MPFDPDYPPAGALIESLPLRAQFQALHDEIATAVTGPPGPPGPEGPVGPAFGTAAVDSVNTVSPGSPAQVTVWSDGVVVHFTFDIPQGMPGEVAAADLQAAINTTAMSPGGVPPLAPGATLAEVIAAFNALRTALIRV